MFSVDIIVKIILINVFETILFLKFWLKTDILNIVAKLSFPELCVSPAVCAAGTSF